jgi:6-phosphofructokinase 1
MGRHSGYIALYTGIGSGAGNIFLPEEEKSIEDLIVQLEKSAKRKKLFNLVIVAEGNKNGGAMEIADQVKVKLPESDVKVTIIGHLQRGGSPTCRDRVLASRLGHSAVELLLQGESRIALGIKNEKVSITSFEEAISKENILNDELIRMAEILAL